MARVVSLSVMVTLIVVLGITFFRVIAPFLLPLFLAGVTAVIFQPLFQYAIDKTRNRVRIAAGLTTVAILGILTIPVLVAILVASIELYQLSIQTQQGGGWAAAFERLHARLVESGYWERITAYLPELPHADEPAPNAGEIVRVLAERSLGLAGVTLDQTLGLVTGTISAVISFLMYVIALYYFFADGPALLAASEQLIPVHVEYQRQLRQRFNEVVRAVIMSTFFAAIVQGLLTAIALRIAGFQHFFLFLVLGTLTAMIPLAGTWLVWGPCAVWLAIHGQWTSAISVTLFGIIVVGTADNLVRTWVLNSDARLHALLAFISVLGGVQAMGLWGLFVGPIVASCLHALVQIFNTELTAWSREAFGTAAVAGTAPATTVAVVPLAGAAQALPPKVGDGAPPPARP